MSDGKFTPGPWTFGRDLTYEFGEWEIDYPHSCSYRHVGSVARPDAPVALVTGLLSREADVEIDANAALIAAAPDLYEALKEMLEMGELFIPAKLHSPGFKRARAALARANQSANLIDCDQCHGDGGYASCQEDCCPFEGGEEMCDDPVCWRKCEHCDGKGGWKAGE